MGTKTSTIDSRVLIQNRKTLDKLETYIRNTKIPNIDTITPNIDTRTSNIDTKTRGHQILALKHSKQALSPQQLVSLLGAPVQDGGMER